MKKFLMLALIAIVLTACGGKSKSAQVAEVLEKAAIELNACKDKEAVMKVETATQHKINEIVGLDHKFKPTEEDIKIMQPALDNYYQTFYDKMVALGEIQEEQENRAQMQQEAAADTVAMPN